MLAARYFVSWRLVSMWFCFVSASFVPRWCAHCSVLCSLFSARYQSVFSMGCMRRSCYSVMTSPQKMCCSCCAQPLRSRRETWWRLCCQVRQAASSNAVLARILSTRALFATVYWLKGFCNVPYCTWHLCTRLANLLFIGIPWNFWGFICCPLKNRVLSCKASGLLKF